MIKFGQNFLKSKKTARKIVDIARIKPDDTVLEVGPGKGILTEILLEKAKKVIAVEKDPALVEYLHKKFKTHKKLELIESDILKINVSSFKFKVTDYKIVSNLPYYITSHFLKTFLETDNQPTTMTLTIQKEVAQRIVAKPPQMNLLSLSVQAYGTPKIASFISKNEFSPVPKVDSAVLTIENISKNFFNPSATSGQVSINEHNFFNLLKKGFAHKRKLLLNNISCNISDFNECKLHPKIRAQELSLENWKDLYLKSLQ
ncbi:16S rRNA (adenine(1518)-N(6)/adenine(1519)-N(6))-dimethyltransferase RsmA [Patescibacteria group bacterium]